MTGSNRSWAQSGLSSRSLSRAPSKGLSLDGPSTRPLRGRLRANGVLIQLLILALFVASASAQQPIRDRVPQIVSGQTGAGLDEETDFFAPSSAQGGISVGAWSAPAYLSFSDADFNERAPDAIQSVLILDQRAWVRWDTKGGQTVFVRARYLDLKYDLSAGAGSPVVFEEGVSLDLGYVDLPEGDVSFRLGRQYLALGRGVTLSQILDGARVGVASGQWGFSAFAATTPNDITDLDPAVGRSDRDFAGFTAERHTRDGHRFFGYFLDQDDGARAAPGQALQYDSRYLALGADGPVADRVSYYVEAIRQDGTTSNRNSLSDRAPIDASAFLGEVAWRPDHEGHPTYFLSYSRASGDPDRASAATNAAGNRAGTPDTAFIGLGRFDGGLGLSPRLTNIAVTRAGATWNLREQPRDSDQLVVGASASLYRKAEAAGPISHPAAVTSSDQLGYGFDASVVYRPWLDLAMTVQAGRFSPGDAFPAGNRDDGLVVYAGLTWSY